MTPCIPGFVTGKRRKAKGSSRGQAPAFGAFPCRCKLGPMLRCLEFGLEAFRFAEWLRTSDTRKGRSQTELQNENYAIIANCPAQARRSRPDPGRPSLDLSRLRAPAHAARGRRRTRAGQGPSPALSGHGLLQFQVEDQRPRPLAGPRSRPNQAFFEERIRAALAVRQKHLPAATSFRVVNAESDFLSGLIVDKYEDVLVVQISSLGMDQRKPLILAALQAIFSPRAIVERSEAVLAQVRGIAGCERGSGGHARRPGADQTERPAIRGRCARRPQDGLVSRPAGELPARGRTGEGRAGAGLFQLSRRVWTTRSPRRGRARASARPKRRRYRRRHTQRDRQWPGREVLRPKR